MRISDWSSDVCSSDLLETSQSPVFLANSRHPLVCAPRTWLPKPGACLSRSYAGNLPSSFSTILSNASVFSTCPPVSVWGTVSRWRCFQELLGRTDNPISPHDGRDPSRPAGRGILTPFPSTTPFGLALGAGPPCAD